MSIATLLWLLAVSGLVTGVAGTASAALRRLDRPERWVWITALAVVATLPFFPAPAPGMDAAGESVAPSTRALSIAQVVTVASSSLPDSALASVPWIPILWAAASLGTVLFMLGGAWSLARRRERWPRRRVDGDLLRVSDRFGPAVVGWIDPEIVMPAWALDMEARQRRLILRHENEHRWARDPQLLGLGVLLLAAAPWNPFAWLQFRSLRRAVEFDCDARVLDSGASPRAYGRLLLSVQLDGARGIPFAPALREPASFLERRLHTMKIRHLPVSRLRVAGLALAAVVLTVVACETPRPTESEDVPETEAIRATGEYMEVAPTTFEAVEGPVDVDPGDIVVFGIGADGAVRVGGLAEAGDLQLITPAQVGPVWRDRTGDDDDRIALVRVAPDTPYAGVVTVLDELKSAGATRITLQGWEDEPGSADATYTISAPDVRIPPPPAPTAPAADGTCPDGADPVVLTGKSGGLAIRGCPTEGANGAASREALADTEPVEGALERAAPGGDAGATPLIHVDGVRIDDETELQRLRPADIERIEVIKGDDARNRYGADAAGGVILIFTKPGD